MTVQRITANVAAENVALAATFYRDVLGLELVMDQGWIQTFASKSQAAPQINIASTGGSGTELPDVSIEVDDLDEVHARCVAKGFNVTYGPVTEPWGVRRFYVRDPFGRVLNILSHDIAGG